MEKITFFKKKLNKEKIYVFVKALSNIQPVNLAVQ